MKIIYYSILIFKASLQTEKKTSAETIEAKK